MQTQFHRAFALAISACAVIGVSGAVVDGAMARPQSPVERRGVFSLDGEPPACDSSSILNKIRDNFNFRENEYWRSGLQIDGFNSVVEEGMRSNGLDYIPRRYCRVVAVLNDGRKAKVRYAVSEAGGWLGIGDGVEWCVEGYDRNFAMGGDCSAARP